MAMLSSLLTSTWRRMTGKAMVAASSANAGDQGVLQSELRAALASILREPLVYPNSIDYAMVAQLVAAKSSADYMVDHMMSAQNLVHQDALLDFALGECMIDGLVLEFGVYRGKSLRAIAKRAVQQVHGFDSFEGLPEDWTYFQKRGRFSLQGEVPHFDEPNIQIHQGWFDQSLTRFLAEHAGPARFIHIDCDLYSSTTAVLQLLSPRIVTGTIILFDEYLNYPAWPQHEYKAFQEFVAQTGKSYRYIGFASSASSVAVKIT
ncbi:MAG TPA: class I SAM-dependent methyltransferase [Burkholderiales bacterium]|jgi:hypothetical protein|nr:class I SAM-dependent methyltransferase [Burkholderiales bacterium]